MNDTIVIKGKISRSKPIYENIDTSFKIYAFNPNIEYENDVVLN